jgi:hypothetical protein
VFIVVQLLTVKHDFSNPVDILILIGSALIFFAAWILVQNFLVNISELKANEGIDEDQYVQRR